MVGSYDGYSVVCLLSRCKLSVVNDCKQAGCEAHWTAQYRRSTT